MHNYIDFVIPAHNEAATVAAVSAACVHAAEEIDGPCTVTVVADHCSDDTEGRARAAGAHVVERIGAHPSKSQAVQEGVRSTEGDIVALVDADCIGLRAEHLIHLVNPILNRQVALSVGVIDYGSILTPLVQRFPWSSGQRVLRRESFNWQDARLNGYMLEMVMNESVGLSGGLTYSSILKGVRHNSKYQKLNTIDGLCANFQMLKSIGESMEDISFDGVSAYFDGIRLRDASNIVRRPAIPKTIGSIALKTGSQIFGR